MRHFLLVSAMVLTLTCGCARREQPLIVYCGAGLMPPVQELLDRFTADHEVAVQPIYSGSGLLLTQMIASSRGDIYLPGDEFYLDQAVRRGLITYRRTAAYFIPVIGVRKDYGGSITGLSDLARRDVRVGLGEPDHCAVGHVSKIILEGQGLFDQVKPVYTSSTVNDLGNQLKLGHLDAAIVWDAVARFYPDDVRIVPIPPDQNMIVTIPAGVLSFSSNPELARQLLDFLTSEVARETFARHGYTVEPPAQEDK